ncbi:hypothetical protein GCM10010399_84390 [Dactylosporangium fulvum]
MSMPCQEWESALQTSLPAGHALATLCQLAKTTDDQALGSALSAAPAPDGAGRGIDLTEIDPAPARTPEPARADAPQG